MLSKHQIVTIYEDPIRQCLREGNAEIVAVGKEFVPGVHLCEVHFLDDAPGVTEQRLVNENACTCKVHAGDNQNCQIHTVRVNGEAAIIVSANWGG